jgi:purine-nucleoside phosphorylase
LPVSTSPNKKPALRVAEAIMPDAIIQPRRGKSSPHLGSVAVLAATEPDVRRLREMLGFNADPGRPIHTSRLYTASESLPDICLVGPFVGAPYAVMLAERLIAWGAQSLLFLGWCGAISEAVAIGDLVLPTSALIDEGTSRHYGAAASESASSTALVQRLSEVCVSHGISAHTGKVWTTDAPFRETPDKVLGYRSLGALAVEMECSALFTLGAFRSAAIASLLVVSDDLSSLVWRHGFKDSRFARGREAAGRILFGLCSAL